MSSQEVSVPEATARGTRIGAPVAASIVVCCFFLSGATGLVYEIIWTRLLILIFGATTFAIATVLTAFMAGLALGSFCFGRLIDRTGKPLFLYGVLEIGIGVYAILAPCIFRSLVPVYQAIWNNFEPDFYVFSLLRFVLVSLILIVPTFLMGGTLPVLSRYYVLDEAKASGRIGTLYAINTLGAVVGTFSSGFILLPLLGVQMATVVAAAANVLLGAISIGLSYGTGERSVKRLKDETEERPPIEPPSQDEALPRPLVVFVLACLACSGFAAMAYEVAWSRTLSLVLGSSVYGMTTMLTTFLAGLAIGSFVFSRFVNRLGKGCVFTVGLIQIAIGLLAFATTHFFNELPYVFTILFKAKGESSRSMLHMIKFGLTFAVMFPATLAMGGMFPTVVGACKPGLRNLGKSVGTIYAINTIGAILGSFCAGWILVYCLGILHTIIACVVLNIVLGYFLLLFSPSPHRFVRLTLCALVPFLLLGVGFGRPKWNALMMSSGMYKYASEISSDFTRESFYSYAAGSYDLLFYREGITTTVTVARDKNSGAIWLATNGKIDASSQSDMPTQVLSGHFPLLIAPKAADVAVVGIASGVTVGAITRHSVKTIKAIEIEKAVVEASDFFRHVNHQPLKDHRVTVIENDARNYFLATSDKFDVLISEPSNPWITGVSNLFTREFFQMGKQRLREGAVFCQWLQLYGINPPELKTLLATFKSVFPYALIFETIDETDLILVGSETELVIDVRKIEERMRREEVKADLAREHVGVMDVCDLLSYFRIGTAGLERLAAGAPLNTDDNALIEFAAPKALHVDRRSENAEAISNASQGIVPYLRNFGATPDEKAAFLLRLANASLSRNRHAVAWRLAKTAQKLHDTAEGRELLERIAESKAES